MLIFSPHQEPLIRIDIEDIGEDIPEPTPPTTTITPHVPDHSVDDIPVDSTLKPTQGTVKSPIIEVIDSNLSSKTPSVNVKTSTIQSTSDVIKENSPGTKPTTKMSVLSTEQEPVKDSAPPYCADSAIKRVDVVTLPPVPESSINLQADWKRVRRDRTILGEYFKVSCLLSYQ